MKYYDQTLQVLSGLYAHLRILYKWDSGKCPSYAKQKEMRIIIGTQYAPQLPESVVRKLSDELPLNEIYAFLQECNAQRMQQIEMRNEELHFVLEKLGIDVKLLQHFLDDGEYEYMSKIQANDTTAMITINESGSFRQQIALHDAKIAGDTLCGHMVWVELHEENAAYCLEMSYEDYDAKPMYGSIEFSSAHVVCESFNAMYDETQDSPWNYIGSVSNELLQKQEVHCPMNEAELQLLPLARMLRAIWLHDNAIEDDREATLAFLQLADLNEQAIISNCIKRPNKLYNTLCYKKFEPLWQRIYDLFASSQQNYPKKAEVLCGQVHLNRVRAEITQALIDSGFSGTYPEFYKVASISKLHVIESYDTTYFIAHEKNTRHYVHCMETYADDLNVVFICGAEAAREPHKNIFSAMFQAKGYRYFRTLYAYLPEKKTAYPEQNPTPGAFAAVAAKKALLQKLSKDEQKNVFMNSDAIGNWSVLAFFLFSGVFFGLFMMLGFMLIEFIITILSTGSFDVFGEVFMQTPWWMIFLLTGFLYGVSMTIVREIARKK